MLSRSLCVFCFCPCSAYILVCLLFLLMRHFNKFPATAVKLRNHLDLISTRFFDTSHHFTLLIAIVPVLINVFFFCN